MNYYKQSNGQRISKSAINARVRDAKRLKLLIQMEEHGYNFCETCMKNDCLPITNAHIISVDVCQKSGNSEKAWDLRNIIIEGIPCHQKRDKTNIQSSKI